MKQSLFMFCIICAVFSFFPCQTVFAQEDATEVDFPPTAILNAVYMGDANLVKRILATGPDIDIRDSLGATALHLAIFRSNLEVIRLLLDYGFDINATVPSNGFTPLHYCVWTNNATAVRLLRSYNADMNIKSKDGQTPLEKAIKEGKRSVIMELSRKN